MRPLGIVIVSSRGNCPAGMSKAREQRLVQQLIAHPTIEALDGAILGRLARRGEYQVIPTSSRHDSTASTSTR